MLRRFLLVNGGEWSDSLPNAVLLYRNVPHDVLRMSPNCALLGMDLRLFGVPPLLPPPSILAEQLKQPASPEEALLDFTIHVD